MTSYTLFEIYEWIQRRSKTDKGILSLKKAIERLVRRYEDKPYRVEIDYYPFSESIMMLIYKVDNL